MNSTNQLVVRIMIGMVAVMGVISAVIILSGNTSENTSGKIIFLTPSLLIYSITASICYVIMRKKKIQWRGHLWNDRLFNRFFTNLFFQLPGRAASI
jgi:hypothetical protein